MHQHADAVETEFRESMASRAEKGYVLPGQMALLAGCEEVTAQMLGYRCVGLAGLANGCGWMEPDLTVSIHAKTMSPFNKSFDALEKDLATFKKKGYRTILISPSRTRARRLAQDLTADGLIAFYSENPERKLEPGEIMTYYGQIRQGFEYPSIGFAVIAESDIFGTQSRKKTKKKKYEGEQIQAFSELKVGDYVVHEDHGIGIYRGVEKIEVNHIAKDYIEAERSMFCRRSSLSCRNTRPRAPRSPSSTSSARRNGLAPSAKSRARWTRSQRTSCSCTRRAGRRRGISSAPIRYGRRSSRRCSPTRRRTISSLPSKRPRKTWRATGSWTA